VQIRGRGSTAAARRGAATPIHEASDYARAEIEHALREME
jgi:hypothetical protein